MDFFLFDMLAIDLHDTATLKTSDLCQLNALGEAFNYIFVCTFLRMKKKV